MFAYAMSADTTSFAYGCIRLCVACASAFVTVDIPLRSLYQSYTNLPANKFQTYIPYLKKLIQGIPVYPNILD